MMRTVDAAAGRQQHLRPGQVQRRSTWNQQQHPVHQQVGDQALHLFSLKHLSLS
jgi:hypothetical protein